VVVAGADVVVVRVEGGAVVEVGLGGQDVVAGAEAPGQGLSCPTITSFAGGGTPKDPGMYGPDPLERYGITSNRFGKTGVPNAVSSGKVYEKMGCKYCPAVMLLDVSEVPVRRRKPTCRVAGLASVLPSR
jgi:hypothetical protein